MKIAQHRVHRELTRVLDFSRTRVLAGSEVSHRLVCQVEKRTHCGRRRRRRGPIARRCWSGVSGCAAPHASRRSAPCEVPPAQQKEAQEDDGEALTRGWKREGQLTRSLEHSRSLNHLLTTLSLALSLTHWLGHTHSLTHSLTRSLTWLGHSLTHWLAHSLTHSLTDTLIR